MNKLLIVDDEKNIRTVVKEYAEAYGYEVYESQDGEEAIDMAFANDFSIIIMDIMMPKVDGYSACRQIRESIDVPIIFLSARGQEYDKLLGFELGIEDYVQKPFSPKELMARINVIVNRNANKTINNLKYSSPKDISFKGIVLNTEEKIIRVENEKIDIRPKEFDLLHYLLKNANKTISREEILDNIWGEDFFGDNRTIDTHIKNIRNYLGEYRDRLITIRGIGYKFKTTED